MTVAAFYNDSGLNLYSVSLVMLLNIQKYLREKVRSHTSNNTHGCKKCKTTLEFRNIYLHTEANTVQIESAVFVESSYCKCENGLLALCTGDLFSASYTVLTIPKKNEKAVCVCRCWLFWRSYSYWFTDRLIFKLFINIRHNENDIEDNSNDI